MRIDKQQITNVNQKALDSHTKAFNFLADTLTKKGVEVNQIVQKISDFQVAIPSWALGAGGTRFGRFGFQGEPGSLEQKIDDVGAVHALTRTAGAISLHIPWDVPNDYEAINTTSGFPSDCLRCR